MQKKHPHPQRLADKIAALIPKERKVLLSNYGLGYVDAILDVLGLDDPALNLPDYDPYKQPSKAAG